MNRDHFWLTKDQFARLEGLLPTDTRGKPRVDDHRVISGCRASLRGPLGLRRVDPATAGQGRSRSADDAVIINPWLAARIGWQQPFEPRELILRQPEMIAIHP